MKEKLTQNIGLKILAVITAVILWFIVLNINDPVDKTTFRNIKVDILNRETVENEGKTFEVMDGTDSIDVTVSANRSILDNIGRENIIATADMEELSLSDTMVKIRVSANKYNDRIQYSQSRENLVVAIEDLLRKQFNITPVIIGEPADNCVIGNITMDQNIVRISGPASEVSQVDHAEVSVDVTGSKGDVKTNAAVNLLDSEGNLVRTEGISRNLREVGIDVEVLYQKRVPVTASVSGTPADGYTLTGALEITPDTVTLVGDSSAVSAVSSITIPDTVVNVAGQTSDVEVNVDISRYLPSGVRLANGTSSGTVKIAANIERFTTTELSIDGESIIFENVPAGITPDISDDQGPLTVRVRGLSTDLALLSSAIIPARINVGEYITTRGLAALNPGEYDMPVVLTLPEFIRQDGTVNARVSIK